MGNGQAVCLNHTLLLMLGTFEPPKKFDWKSYELPLVHAYNATRHETTGFPPIYLMFGCHPRLSIDVFFGLNPSVESGNCQEEYETKFFGFAYKKATEEAAQQSANY